MDRFTPWTRTADGSDPAREMTFYLGVGHPTHLVGSPVPLFLSAPTLARYRTTGDRMPLQMGSPWAGDSGAYAALMLNKNSNEHPWSWHPDEYGGMWVRLIDDIGPCDFVAIQDWPCEPSVRERTKATVREHQEDTLRSYLYLAEEFYMVPWLPVLQGWHPWEYVEHFEMYAKAGVDLTGRRVGIGSVCRRGSQNGIAQVLQTLAPFGMRMHGFGVSINGLRLAGHLLASSDSQAWSATARRENIRLDGCTHTGRDGRPNDCRNCFRYALHYRERVMDALRENARAPHQEFDLWAQLAEQLLAGTDQTDEFDQDADLS